MKESEKSDAHTHEKNPTENCHTKVAHISRALYALTRYYLITTGWFPLLLAVVKLSSKPFCVVCHYFFSTMSAATYTMCIYIQFYVKKVKLNLRDLIFSVPVRNSFCGGANGQKMRTHTPRHATKTSAATKYMLLK